MAERTVDPAAVERLAEEILGLLRREPRHFIDVLRHCRGQDYRLVLLAWSRLREQHALGRDTRGRYLFPEPSSGRP